MNRTLTLTAAVVLILVGTSCREPYTEDGWATKSITQSFTFPARDEAGKVIPEGVTVSAKDIDMGRQSYMHYCFACHGVNGDGKGPSSPGLRPPPRDFRSATFKFGAVRSGEKPSDDDLVRIVLGGLHGTPMLEWDIPEVQLRRIIQFIKTFPQARCDAKAKGEAVCAKELEEFPDGKPSRWLDIYKKGKKKGQPKPVGEPVAVPADPWAGKAAEAVKKGEEIYHLKAQCASCHPNYMTKQDLYDLSLEIDPNSPISSFRKGMYSGIVLEANKNPYGVNLMPPDFLLNPVRSVRDAHEMTDLFRLIASGVGGVMPAWVDGLKPEEIWALAHYIKSMTDLREYANRKALGELQDKLAKQPPFVFPSKEPKAVALTINKDGDITLDGQAVKLEDLEGKLKDLLKSGPVEASVSAAGDDVEDDKLTELVAAVKKAGVESVSASSEDDDDENEDDDDAEAEGGEDAPKAPAPKAPAPKAPAPKAPAPKAPAPKAPAPKAPAPKAPPPKAPAPDPYGE